MGRFYFNILILQINSYENIKKVFIKNYEKIILFFSYNEIIKALQYRLL